MNQRQYVQRLVVRQNSQQPIEGITVGTVERFFHFLFLIVYFPHFL